MFHIYVVIIGVIMALLLLFMGGTAQVSGWPTAIEVTGKVALGLVAVFGGLGCIGLFIYGLGLLVIGIYFGILIIIFSTYEKLKSCIIGLFRKKVNRDVSKAD